MKKLFSLRYLTAWCFLLFLALFFLLSLGPFASALRELRGPDTAPVEAAYQQAMPRKTDFVTINGGFRRLLGERAVNERYRLDNGQLTYIIPELDMTRIAANTVAFAETLEQRGIPFLYVNTTFKTDEADKQLPVGVEDYANENADRFLALLREKGVDTLDLRERERTEGLDHYSRFYPTDHHWTAETGFWAFTEIVDALAARDASFAVDGRITDLDSYRLDTRENIFLGSAGRRVGPWYAGMDDLTIITPAFNTHLAFQEMDQGFGRDGSFAETFLFPEMLEGSPFEVSRYDVYLGGEYGELRLDNLSREENLPVQSTEKKSLLLKDSASLVVAPFLSLGYDSVRLLDLRLYGGNLMTYIEDYEPDLVLAVYNPGAYEDNNWEMFDFLP